MHTVDPYGWTILKNNKGYYTGSHTGYGVPEAIRTSVVAQKPIAKYVKEKNIVVEIGVYYGFTTRYLSTVFKTVHTFDFDNDVAECFRINMKKFGCSNVISHNHALGDCEETITYPYEKYSSTYMSAKKSKTKQFQVKPLDDCDIPTVDFMIIDAENYTPNVLIGGASTIDKNKPPIVCKISGHDALVKNLGYKKIQQVTDNDAIYLHKEQI